MPRKPKETPARVTAIITMLEDGHTRRASCWANGISEDTFARWLSKAEFAESVQKAEARAEQAAAAIVLESARGYATTRTKTSVDAEGNTRTETLEATERHWQAAAWWLERRRPEEYSITTKVRLEVQDEIRNLFDYLRSRVSEQCWSEVERALTAADAPQRNQSPQSAAIN